MDKDVMIRVEGVSKRYALGAKHGEGRPTSFREMLTQQATALFRRPARRTAATESETDFWALRDVSFEVGRGEVVGIIGRNGAGKSTLLKVLSRITEPTAGRIALKGRVASLLEVGTGFHPELTGRENIFLNGAILGMHRAEIKAKFEEIVAFAEVERFLDTPVKRYSSGMYVRLAFAVAAHLEPEILIVDEVLAVGDAQFQQKCLGKMKDVSKGEGRTVLFVSHNMAAMQALCTQAVYLKSGSIVSGGEAGKTIGQYLMETRAAMNRSTGEPRRLDANFELRAFKFTPRPVQTGGPARFRVELAVQQPTRLMESAIIIYSSAGVRVAVLDLRAIGSTSLNPGASPLAIQGSIPSLSLVEGSYNVGLYVKTETTSSNFEDLTALEVCGPPPQSGFIPFPPEHRGFVELPCLLDKQA